MNRTGWRHQRAIFAVVAACSMLACERSLFVEPATPKAGIAIAYNVSSDPAAAFAKANRVRIQVSPPGSTSAAFDTVMPFSPAEETRVRISVPSNAVNQAHDIDVMILRDSAILFRGGTTVTLVAGETTP